MNERTDKERKKQKETRRNNHKKMENEKKANTGTVNCDLRVKTLSSGKIRKS